MSDSTQSPGSVRSWVSERSVTTRYQTTPSSSPNVSPDRRRRAPSPSTSSPSSATRSDTPNVSVLLPRPPATPGRKRYRLARTPRSSQPLPPVTTIPAPPAVAWMLHTPPPLVHFVDLVTQIRPPKIPWHASPIAVAAAFPATALSPAVVYGLELAYTAYILSTCPPPAQPDYADAPEILGGILRLLRAEIDRHDPERRVAPLKDNFLAHLKSYITRVHGIDSLYAPARDVSNS